MRPVIPGIGRVVRGEPFELGGYEIPRGRRDQPVDRGYPPARRPLSRSRASSAPSASSATDPPDTYTWIPFGGGTRRCLGASFAQLEMRVVIARVLERAHLEPVGRGRRRSSPRHHDGPEDGHAGDRPGAARGESRRASARHPGDAHLSPHSWTLPEPMQ